MAFRKYALTQADLNPSEFGNWVLVDRIEVVNGVVNKTYDWDGDKDSKILVRSSFKYGGTGSSAYVYLRPNGDSVATNYVEGSIIQDGNVLSGSYGSSLDGIMVGIASSNSEYDINCEGILKNIGNYRKFSLTLQKYIASNTDTLIQSRSQRWNNITSKITSLSLITIQSSGGTLTGFIEIYKWQDVNPVKIHSYELVKEYILNNQTLSDTISVDGDVDDRFIIEYNLKDNLGSTNQLKLNLNGDTAANYRVGLIQQDGSVIAAVYSATQTNISTAQITGGVCAGLMDLYLKTNGGYRSVYVKSNAYVPANNDYQLWIANFQWMNTASKVTSLNLSTTGGVTGIVRVYKIARTELLSSSPNLLCGLWQKYVDANTIQIQPGEIEIAGVNCYLNRALNLTLSGNLRTGETESASTYHYLYAIKDTTGRGLTFKFSKTAPTLDRYGNTVASFTDCYFKVSWYHPIEGRTWRYIGQVYNDSSSNIFTFAKCYPGYWESNWTSIPGLGTQTLNHGFGKIPVTATVDVIFSTSSSGDSNLCKGLEYWSTNSENFGTRLMNAMSTNTIIANFGEQGAFYMSGWQTSGYYKIVIREQ